LVDEKTARSSTLQYSAIFLFCSSGSVDQEGVAPPFLEAHLPEGLQEGEALDVADCAAAFDQEHVGVGVLSDKAEAALNLVGDMGYDLDAPPKITPLTLLPDDVLVHLTGCDVVQAGELDAQEPLVGAEVHVRLVAVVEDEDLAVDVGVHGTRVDVEIGIALDHTNADAPHLKNLAEGTGHQPFPKAA